MPPLPPVTICRMSAAVLQGEMGALGGAGKAEKPRDGEAETSSPLLCLFPHATSHSLMPCTAPSCSTVSSCEDGSTTCPFVSFCYLPIQQHCTAFVLHTVWLVSGTQLERCAASSQLQSSARGKRPPAHRIPDFPFSLPGITNREGSWLQSLSATGPGTDK